MTFIVGIDEAGRGPLAGPVSVGVVSLPIDFDVAQVVGARDSKLMTPRTRDRLYETICGLRRDGLINFAVGFSDAHMIDTEGIVPSINRALTAALDALGLDPALCDVRLDGGLKAPSIYRQQTTIIKGDQKEISISLASIAAKVERDRHMTEIAAQYPLYNFDIHKGYGTAAHLRLIREHGLCPAHRRSFCTRI